MNKNEHLFDYSVSNPPYQQVLSVNKSFNNVTISMYDKIQMYSIVTSDKSIMIYPAGRWWFNTSMNMRQHIFDNHLLEHMEYWDGKESLHIFPQIELNDGVNIVKLSNNNNSFQMKHNDNHYVSSEWGKDPLPITAEDCVIFDKISTFIADNSLKTIRDYTNFQQNQIKMSSKKLKELSLKKYNDDEFNDNLLKLYANASGSISGTSEMYMIRKDLVKNYNGKYQVCFRQGILENPQRKWKVFLFDNKTVYGNSSVLLFSTDSPQAACNFYKYAYSNFFEYCIRIHLPGRKKVLGSIIPDFTSYEDNTIIDWDKNIDQQIYNLIGLDNEDIQQIEKSLI